MDTSFIKHKIFSLKNLKLQVAEWKFLQKKISFTNGVFDILHEGHIFSLMQAANEADVLIIGLNADKSVKKLKGDSRPINSELSRALLLASLVMVDAVCIFNEETPLHLIQSIKPDVLVKGGDYTIDQIVGAKETIQSGGRVVVNSIIPNFSTTGIIEKINKQNTDE